MLVVTQTTITGKPVLLRGRFERPPTGINTPGAAYQQADVAALTYTVYLDGQAVSGHDSVDLFPSLATIVFDTLQGWDQDARGYNLQTTIPGAAFGAGGRVHRVAVDITLTAAHNDLAGAMLWDITTRDPAD